MTLQEHNELLACLTFFLKHASDEHLYFGGHSSQKAWDAFAKLMYNVTGDELATAINDQLDQQAKHKSTNTKDHRE